MNFANPIATLLFLLMCCKPAIAGSAYDEVPLDHWSYKVLEYWQDRLLVHPEQAEAIRFSEAGQPQTRYEFVLPTAIAIDGLDRNYPLGDFVLMEVMRLEYSDQWGCGMGGIRQDADGNDLSYPQELVVSDLRLKPSVKIDCDSANTQIVAMIIDYLNFVGRLDIPNQFRDSFLPMTAQDISKMITESDIEGQPVVDRLLLDIVHTEIEDQLEVFNGVVPAQSNPVIQEWIPRTVNLDNLRQWRFAYNSINHHRNTSISFEFFPDPEQFELATAPEVQQRHSAYDEVPRDHWAYALFDYLVNDPNVEWKVVQPGDFFSREDRLLTRYEFASAALVFGYSIFENGSDSQKMLLHICMNEFKDQIVSMGHTDHFVSLEISNLGMNNEIQGSMRTGASADVPPEHWAYDAVEFFIDSGTLEGYPAGFYDRSRILSPYEFAQAIARLLDILSDQENPYPYEVQIAECLRVEFSDQLDSISS